MTDPTPSFTFDPSSVAEVDASSPVHLTQDDLRLARRVRDGTHQWVVGLVYAVSDPEQALDDMTFGGHNLIGALPIYCLWCQAGYTSPTDPAPVCPA